MIGPGICDVAGARSSTVGWTPRRARLRASVRPAMPPPTITTCIAASRIAPAAEGSEAPAAGARPARGTLWLTSGDRRQDRDRLGPVELGRQAAQLPD